MLILASPIHSLLYITLFLMLNYTAYSQSMFSFRGFSVYFGERKIGQLVCQGEGKATLETNVIGIGRNYPAKFNLVNDGPNSLKIDDVAIPQVDSLPISELTDHCKNFQFRRSFQLQTSQLKQLESSFATVLPVCKKIQLEGDAFRCDMTASSIKGLRDIIAEQRKKLIAWSRQPYFIMRRLEVTRQLANAVDANSDIDGVCKVITKSLPMELPFVFNDLNWRKEFCEPRDENIRNHVGLVALQLAVDEMNLLLDITDKETYQGVYRLSLEEPEKEKGKVKYWIRFSPTDETRANFYQSVKLHQAQKLTYNGLWHPIYGTSWHPTRSFDAESDTEKSGLYVWQSLAGETEFLVSKGYSKMLRLPQGTYSVSAYRTTEQPFQIAGQVLEKAEIDWQRGRPARKVISRR